VANHPLGMLDAMALMDLIGSVRGDVRILGNDVLTAMERLMGMLLIALSVQMFMAGVASFLHLNV
jgi:small neutral amino acid transporter SnatA (MarC family)